MILPKELSIRFFALAAVLWSVNWIALAQPRILDAAASPPTNEPRRARFYGVASIRVFNNVNRNDAKAAIKVWFDVLAQHSGFVLDTKVDVLDSVAEIRERLQNHSVELAILGISDYLEIESSHLVVPVLTDARTGQGAAPYSYVLLVNSASGIATVAGLRGKNLLMSSRGAGKAGMEWLEILLAKEKLGRAAQFFGSVKSPDKPQACILPLFFGAVDACVVDEVNLDLAKEMNPQVGRLKVIARSVPLIESVIATPVESRPYEKDLIDAMLSLHQDPRGRQLLMVFKTDRLVRIQAGDLDTPRALWKEYCRLTGSTPQIPANWSGTQTGSDPAERGKGGH